VRSPTLLRTLVVLIGVACCILGGAGPAGATWSIVGVDPDAGEVGVAVASCVPLTMLDTSDGFDLIVLVPGVGAAISQAEYLPRARDELERQLVAGSSAVVAVAAVTDTSFDRSAARRQHGVVTLDGTSVGFTGGGNFAVAVDRQAPNVSVQGNILLGERVADDALAAFVADGDRTLSDRLVDALEAGSLAGGDARCDEQTALFAHVSVIDGDGSRAAPNVLDLTTSVEPGDGRNPVTELAAQYRADRVVVRAPTTGEASEDGGSGSSVLVLVAVIGAASLLVIAAGVAVSRSTRRA